MFCFIFKCLFFIKMKKIIRSFWSYSLVSFRAIWCLNWWALVTNKKRFLQSQEPYVFHTRLHLLKITKNIRNKMKKKKLCVYKKRRWNVFLYILFSKSVSERLFFPLTFKKSYYLKAYFFSNFKIVRFFFFASGIFTGRLLTMTFVCVSAGVKNICFILLKVKNVIFLSRRLLTGKFVIPFWNVFYLIKRKNKLMAHSFWNISLISLTALWRLN